MHSEVGCTKIMDHQAIIDGLKTQHYNDADNSSRIHYYDKRQQLTYLAPFKKTKG